jgi:heat shock protein 5
MDNKLQRVERVLMFQILANDMGNRITPSYVAFTPDERLVGDAAKAQYANNPTNTVFDIKYGS